MAKIYYQEDCNLSLLDGKTISGDRLRKIRDMHMPLTQKIPDAMLSSDYMKEANPGREQKNRDLKYIQLLRLQKKQHHHDSDQR